MYRGGNGRRGGHAVDPGGKTNRRRTMGEKDDNPRGNRDWLGIGLVAVAVSYAAQAVLYVPEIFEGPSTTRPFALNSVVKDSLFCVITAYAARDLRRRSRLVGIAAFGMSLLTLLLLLTVITGDTGYSFPPPRWLEPAIEIPQGARAPGWCVAAFLMSALLVAMARRA